jgi:hypothetical protein
MWRTGSYNENVWHFMLENPHTGERHGFGNLGALMAFLETRTGEDARDPDDSGSEGEWPKAGTA